MRSFFRFVTVVGVAALLPASGAWLSRLPAISTCLSPGENSASAAPESAAAPASAERRPLYYRKSMGLPDVSPTPKKDSIGMVHPGL